MKTLAITLFTLVLSLFCARLPAYAATWVIEADRGGDFATIQDGIDAAGPDDVLQLGDGFFTGPGNRNIDFLGKAITVTSQNGPAATIIDCEELGWGFVFQNGEDSRSVLSGVTIQNAAKFGFGERGGAIGCDAASPTIRGNVLKNNRAALGGAIGCTNGAAPLITENELTNNEAGEFFLADGGAIHIDQSSPTITANRFVGNAGQSGGAIMCQLFSNTVIQGNVFANNGANSEGGALHINSSTAEVLENVFYGNSASGGGGMWIQSALGGVYRSNTLVDNSASVGSGIWASANLTIEKTIIAFGQLGQGIVCSSNITVSCCVIFGNAGGDDVCGIDAENNQTVDPQLCGSPSSGFFFLQSDSPCTTMNSLCNARIGALGVRCGTTTTKDSSWGELKARYRTGGPDG